MYVFRSRTSLVFWHFFAVVVVMVLLQMHIPIVNAWQLNERHYGGLTGLDKQETVEKHGIDQVAVVTER